MKTIRSKKSSGALRHIRRKVLVLLGWHNHALRSGIARFAREANWLLDDEYVRVGLPPSSWQGHGILGLITNAKDVEALRLFPRLPLVDLSKGWIADTMPAPLRRSGIGCPRVYYDNERIGRLAAEHFIERGFKEIAYLNFGNYWLETERIPAFRDAVEAAASQFHEIEYYKQLSRRPGIRPQDNPAAHNWLVQEIRRLPKPLGVAVSADDEALELLRACDDAELSVPEEVAVLGCDNDPLICDYAPVPLSSVDIDWETVGYEGAKLLDCLMDGEPAPREPILIPPKGVVARMSTNILAVPNIQIARAVRFIWEHHHETIGTPEVAKVAGLSRRALERAFFKYIGRNVAQEILHCRVERAKKLLLETDLKAHEVAAQAGFSGIVHFSQAFNRVTGQRPSYYRRQHQKRVD